MSCTVKAVEAGTRAWEGLWRRAAVGRVRGKAERGSKAAAASEADVLRECEGRAGKEGV